MKKILSFVFAASLALFFTGCVSSPDSPNASSFVDLSTPEKTIKEFYQRLYNDDIGNAMSLLVYYGNLDKSQEEAGILFLKNEFQTKANLMRSAGIEPKNLKIKSKTADKDGIITIIATLIDENNQEIDDRSRLINVDNEWKLYR